ncbi:substrate-binding periplasmic protein [Iodobacter arcticus]|uniref:Substrate-binding periplasmic protein n=1 Tax=Iodobacter arcticus TaxID=590593 RepID=A0ABW2R1R9_9NEIS
MKSITLIIVGLALILATGAQARVTLRIGVNQQSSPPYIMGDSLQLQPLPGIAIEQIRSVAGRCDVLLELERLPPLRLLNSLKTNLVQGVLMLSYTEERADFAVYPMRGEVPDHGQRLTTLSYSFFVNKQSKLTWDGKAFNDLQNKVGVNLGWSVIKDLERLTIPYEAALSVENNFAKLNAGRIDAYATQQNVGEAFLLRNKHLKVKRLDPEISKKDYFLIFSKDFYAEHPKVSACIWKSIGDEREKLLKTRMPAYLQAD